MRWLIMLAFAVSLFVGCGDKGDPKRGTHTDTSDPSKIEMGPPPPKK